MIETTVDNISLLYVEDDDDIRENLVDILEGEVKELFVAKDGQEGLEKFKEFSPDVIITDIQMPKLNGIEMAQKIKKISPTTPIIVTSAFNDSQYLLDAIKSKINHYLLKPINFDELFTTLEIVSESIMSQKKLAEMNRLVVQYNQVINDTSLVFKLDQEFNINFVNYLTLSTFKIKNEEDLLKENFFNFLSTSVPTIVKKEIAEDIRCFRTWMGKLKLLNNNENIYLETTIAPIVKGKSTLHEYLVICTNITEKEKYKKKIEEKLDTSLLTLEKTEQNAKRHERALNESTIFCRIDKNSNFIECNLEFSNLLEFQEKDLIDKKYWDLIDDSQHDEMKNLISLVLFSNQKHSQTFKYYSKTRETIYFEATFVPVEDIYGKVSELTIIHSDITAVYALNIEIEKTQKELIEKMGAVGERRSKETGDHVKRVAEYSKLLAIKAGLSLREAENLRVASPMHDIGKIAIADSILNKPGKLTKEEYEEMKTHSLIGYDILKSSNRKLLKIASIVAKEHHERYDGKGYPHGLKGDEIHIYGRITAIADVFDALGHDRVYKEAWSLEKILRLFREEKGKHFDPYLMDLFLDNLDEFLKIKEKFDG